MVPSLLFAVQSQYEVDILKAIFESPSHQISFARRTDELMSRAAPPARHDVIAIDFGLIADSPLESLRRIAAMAGDAEIILISEFETMQGMEDELLGLVYSHVYKMPGQYAHLKRAIQNAIEKRALIEQNNNLMKGSAQHSLGGGKDFEPEFPESPGYLAAQPHELIGESQAIQRIRGIIAEIARTEINVMIRGESGTGKDVAANMIHEASAKRSREPFVKVNCPSIPDSLLESELFGHEAGAFTGAMRRKPGRFELAMNGTVFLDEIAEIPIPLQAKLLQFIESKQFARVGGIAPIQSNARIVSGTNKNLESMIANGQFREDLFYRLNEYVIHMPPLRERVEDIPLLVDHFYHAFGREFHRNIPAVSPDVMAAMMQYSWPGNIRELRAMMKRYVITGSEKSILTSMNMLAAPAKKDTISDELRAAEKKAILSALIKAHWNQKKAASLLGMSYSSLRRRITKYKLNDPPGLNAQAG